MWGLARYELINLDGLKATWSTNKKKLEEEIKEKMMKLTWKNILTQLFT